MALGSTQPLTEMSTRNISWGVKAIGAYGWQPYYLHVPTVLKSGNLNLLEPSGPVQVCNGIALPLSLQSDTHTNPLHYTVKSVLNKDLAIREIWIKRETFTGPRIQTSSTCIKRNLPATFPLYVGFTV